MAKRGTKSFKDIISSLADMPPDEFAKYSAKTMLEKIAWRLLVLAADGDRSAIDSVLKTILADVSKVEKIVITGSEDQEE